MKRRCLRHGGHHVWIEITLLGDARQREMCGECGRERFRRFSSPYLSGPPPVETIIPLR